MLALCLMQIVTHALLALDARRRKDWLMFYVCLLPAHIWAAAGAIHAFK